MNILANKIAVAIKRANPEQTHSIEIMQYSLGILLNTLFSFAVSLLIAWLTGKTAETLLFFFSFAILRMCSGGFHLKTALACNTVSIVLCTTLPHFSVLPANIVIILNCFNLLTMLLFAPSPDVNVKISATAAPLLKAISVLLVGCNFFIGSSVIGLAFFTQSLTVITLKGRETIEKNLG
ncbi:accessory gene regulator ArgB-like protein [Paenibacillus sp. S150]|uniref:accessory gene regulator ArgB-like protein n=1 Tax=Paenibacillus sp. S150 TaxID=2749826 RepID=UPI001C588EE7|nr:accessory gene regulator B family protein [Paenibacillus sp. S150]MBW4081787.1 accessory gene regulator B family protein [Paenibacillus sp. S150]